MTSTRSAPLPPDPPPRRGVASRARTALFALLLAACDGGGGGGGGGGGSDGGDGGGGAAGDSGVTTDMRVAPPDGPVELDGPPLSDGALPLDVGRRDDAARDAEPCTPGEEDCQCAEDDGGVASVCDDGLTCRDEVCVDCAPGSSECPCLAGNTCDDGLVCGATGRCEGCDPGEAMCACLGGTCNGDLVCDGATRLCRGALGCDVAGCAQGQLCEQLPGEDGACLEECEAGFEWTGVTCQRLAGCGNGAGSPTAVCAEFNRACTADGGMVSCGACLAGAMEVDGECQPAGCPLAHCDAEFRRCVDGPDCGPCLFTHAEVEAGGRCDVRTCDELLAEVGDCVEGAHCDVLRAAADACEPRTACAALNCPAGTECVPATPESDAFCAAPGCEPGQVQRGDRCINCDQCYTFDAQGRATPRDSVIGNEPTPTGNICVCRFADGSDRFQNVTTGEVLPCDADGDGWVNSDILPTLALDEGDNPLARNHRCALREIDKFELISEDAPEQRFAVTLEALAAAHTISPRALETDDDGLRFARLLEPPELDTVDGFDGRYEPDRDPQLRLRPYGGAGRRLTAAEVNPLTKACNDDRDDLNYDGVADVAASQEAPFMPPPGRNVGWMAPFFHMAYYLEAAQGYYRPPANGETRGAYVIEEKSRARTMGRPTLDLTYPESDDTAWRTCARSRDAAWPGAPDPGDPASIGFDFARWRECADPAAAAGGGACLVDDARHGDSPYVPYDGRVPASNGALGGVAPDALWPGMNHPSQFRCVSLVGGAAPAGDPGVIADARVRVEQLRRSGVTDAPYSFLACDLEADPENRRLPPRPAAMGPNPADPDLICSVIDDAGGLDALAAERAANRSRQNYWVAARYQHYDRADATPALQRYRRGCINEAREWPFVCSGYAPDPVLNRSFPVANRTAFGTILCGCGLDRAGEACEVGCAPGHGFVGGPYTSPELEAIGCADGFCPNHPPTADFPGGPRGFWLCGDVAASWSAEVELTDGQANGYRLIGRVPSVSVQRTPMTGEVEFGGRPRTATVW